METIIIDNENKNELETSSKNDDAKNKKKDDFFIKENIKRVDYKDIEILKKFVNRQGRIVKRKLTNLTAKNQRKLTKAVKRARQLLLIPYSTAGEGI